jgi:hypothetical protein
VFRLTYLLALTYVALKSFGLGLPLTILR